MYVYYKRALNISVMNICTICVFYKVVHAISVYMPYGNMHKSMNTYIHNMKTHVCVYMHASTCMCIYIYINISSYSSIYIYIYTYKLISKYIYMFTHKYMDTHIHTYVYKYTLQQLFHSRTTHSTGEIIDPDRGHYPL